MPKENLRDRLEGDELDLSLTNLSEIPVKEIAKLPQATHLDLSCNLLKEIPDVFCQLRHLVKIDLSKNKLEALPDTFGMLDNLKHLDLLGNQLTELPLSFHKLNRLRWLDLKDNPLDEEFSAAAGDCLNEDQCKKCAQNILQLMKQLNSNAERQKQWRLKKERELEAARLAEEKEQAEQEIQRKKQEKQREKERRRQMYEERRRQEQEQMRDSSSSDAESSAAESRRKRRDPKKSRPERHSCGFCWWFMLTMVTMVLIAVAIFFHCNRQEDPLCQTYVQPAIHQLNDLYIQTHKIVLDTYTSFSSPKKT